MTTRYLQGVRLQGVCARCGQSDEVSIYGTQPTPPDHVHVTCVPCGRPTLYVKLPSEAPVPDCCAQLGESTDAERAQTRAEHLGELAAEREMTQAQMPVVNVDFPQVERRGEAPNG